MTRLAVVLLNLGGPDGQKAVRPFLFNLFRDPAILQIPAVIRYPLAAFISGLRAKAARANYALMGGGSPLLPQTEAQAEALRAALKAERPDVETRVFISMRYWRPFSHETARQVAAFAPDEIVLLPLYPQYSTTTTGSSLAAWARSYRGPGVVRAVGCYPVAEGWVSSVAASIRETWITAGRPENIRLLFSAHGLPQKVVNGGDPYEAQVRAGAAAVAAKLPELSDWRVCFQSRVGPLKWLEPSTVTAIQQAGAEAKGVLISPIAFVSEHIETLVELDKEYAHLAEKQGVRPYLRAPTPGCDPAFIEELAHAALGALSRRGTAPHGAWRCPKEYSGCGCGEAFA